MLSTLFVLLAAAGPATAHFQIEYPAWRADSLQNASYSQWVYPCAGVPYGVAGSNRTAWSLDGGSLKLDLHHPWTYIFVNLGLGQNVSNFNYTLTPNFWNETGNGTLCIPKVPLPASLNPTDGQNASIQIVTLGANGQALYNCADITFSSNVTEFGGQSCTTDPGVSFSAVSQEVNGSTSTGGSGGSGTSGTSAGSMHGVSMATLASVIALVVGFLCMSV